MTSTQDGVGIRLTKLAADDVIVCDSMSPTIYPEPLHAQDEIYQGLVEIEDKQKLHILSPTQFPHHQYDGLNASRTSPEGRLRCYHRCWALRISSS
jgi:hypothetical protein